MKIGDLVRIRNRGLSIYSEKKYLGYTGIITEILKSEVNDDGGSSIVNVMLDSAIESFLPRCIEIINEK